MLVYVVMALDVYVIEVARGWPKVVGRQVHVIT